MSKVHYLGDHKGFVMITEEMIMNSYTKSLILRAILVFVGVTVVSLMLMGLAQVAG